FFKVTPEGPTRLEITGLKFSLLDTIQLVRCRSAHVNIILLLFSEAMVDVFIIISSDS
ncbi:hypothetical protein STEG23_013044, partial [Scotinomys teguina]